MIDEMMRTISYILPIILLAFPFIIIHLFIKWLDIRRKNNIAIMRNVIAMFLLIVSIIFIISLTIGRNIVLSFNTKILYANLNMNLKPLVQIFFDTYLIFMGNKHKAIHIIGNIIMFIPAGFCVGLYFKKDKYCKIKTLTILLLFSLGIESLQILISRGFDVNDIILNEIGSIVGYNILSYMAIYFSDTFSPIDIHRNTGSKKWSFFILLNWIVYVLFYLKLFVHINI